VFAISTDVDRVCLRFPEGDPPASGHHHGLGVPAHLADGQFPAGSMGPKITAALKYLERGAGTAVITDHAIWSSHTGEGGHQNRDGQEPLP